jgi:hypothetical protein
MDSVGLFCEDIREEVGGSHSIVGVMPDNINLQGPENDTQPEGKLLFPKMGFYIRVRFDARQTPPKQIAAEVSIPGNPVMKLGTIETDAMKTAFADSIANNAPFVGVLFKAVTAPVPITESGLATLRVFVDGEEHICGTLNIKILE